MKNLPVLLSVLLTLAISFVFGFICIQFFGDYGWFLFVFIPFFMGFFPPFIFAKNRKTTKKECFSIGFTTLGFAILGLLAFALEGLICIVMASPILALLTWLGAYLGFKANEEKFFDSTNILLLLIASSASFMSFDQIQEMQAPVLVKTQMMVEAPIEKVWKEVTTLDIEAPAKDWVFKTGIAYPKEAKIRPTATGANLHCSFTTGSFVEPLTLHEELHLLEFKVKNSPMPMNELNPFWDIHPPHLDGYFQIKKGQIQLSPIDENHTLLKGSTWYQSDIHPATYWQVWSDFIIDRMHLRVLHHIKKESEKTN